jgi:uncharacterized membrane protein
MGDVVVSAYWIDWAALLGRWVHLITGIAWIGASFYFVWLDNHLVPPAEEALARKGVGGELWAVHGGGFYNSQKYLVAPGVLPAAVHWFYWEAYSTFLSGFFLLCLLYFGQAEIYLIDPAVAPLSKPAAIGIGLAFIAGGWLVYDGLCRSPLARHGALLGGVLAVLFGAAAFALCSLFSGRGAYIEFGAMMGTIMVANVFFVIIPGQRDLVGAKREGREPDPRSGARGKLRSVHNTYFTLPVLFTMISNHYAMTFGARHNAVVLVALCAAGALIRVYFVARHRLAGGGRAPLLPALAGMALLALTAWMLLPRQVRIASAASPAQRFERVQRIVSQRCTPCHATAPTQPGFAAAPKGLTLDTPAAILAHAAQMQPQLAAKAMPIGDLTGMTDDERGEVLDWIARGTPH